MKKLFRSVISVLLALSFLAGSVALSSPISTAEAASKKPNVYIRWDNRSYKKGQEFARSDNGKLYGLTMTIHYSNNVTKLRARFLNPNKKVVAGQDETWTTNGTGTITWSITLPKGLMAGKYRLVINAYQGKKATTFSFYWTVTKYVYSAFPNSEMQAKFNYLKSKLPQGKYWNHGVKNTKTVYLNNGVTTSISSSRCNSWSHRGQNCFTSRATCNHVSNGYQCHGFALLLAEYVWGGLPSWYSRVSDKKAADTLEPGDVVRFLNDQHTIFVLKVKKGTVYYADCNTGNTCRISWNGKISAAKLKKTFSYVYKYSKR